MEKLKQRLFYFGKLILAVGLIVIILLQINREKFFSYFSEISAFQLSLILPLSIASLYVQFLRWRYLVSSYSASFEVIDLIPSFFAGFTLRLLVPGGHAEISKVYLLPGKKGGKVMAFGMERFFQTFIKVILMTIVVPLHFKEYIVPVIVILMGFMALYFWLPHIPLFNRIREKEVHYHQLFAINLVYALVLFIIMTIQYYILLNSVHPISIFNTGQIVVYLWGAGVIPISISGLGIREGLAAYFFAQYGFAPAYAVATSLFLFTLNNIIPALYGGYFIYRKRSHFKDIKQTLQSTRELWHKFKNGK
jgi:hypothetical protein